MNLIRLKYRLLSLEFEYRIKNKDFDRSRKVLEYFIFYNSKDNINKYRKFRMISKIPKMKMKSN